MLNIQNSKYFGVVIQKIQREYFDKDIQLLNTKLKYTLTGYFRNIIYASIVYRISSGLLTMYLGRLK